MSKPVSEVLCGECGAPTVLRHTPKFKYRNGKSRPFYGCSRWPDCNGTHGAHPDGRPMGIPANKETREWRHRAHLSFDQWGRSRGNSRRESYASLAEHFGVKEIHIGDMDIEACKKVIRFCGDRI